MKRFPVSVLVFVAALGCNGGKDTGTTDTGTCSNSIISTFPADGATDAYYRTTIEVKFDNQEDSASFAVADGDGNDVSGSSDWNGDTLVLTPDSPLAPSTTYTITIDYSCATGVTQSFTTSEVGTAVDTSGHAMDGRSYLLDLSSGRFVQPEGVGDIIGDYLDQIVIVGVDHVDAENDTLVMLGALGEQDSTRAGGAHTADGSMSDIFQACEPTINFPDAPDFSTNPYFSAGPADTTISVAGFSVDIQHLQISGAFGPDGSYISGATLAGKIDTRPLVPFVSTSPAPCDQATYDDGTGSQVDNPNYPCDPNAICSIAASLNIACEPCGADSTATTCGDTGSGDDACCLNLLVDSMNASELLDATNASWPLQATSEPGTGDTGTGTVGDPIDPCSADGITCDSSACAVR